MHEISKSTGLSVDEVVDIQLDDEPFPGKPVSRRIYNKQLIKSAKEHFLLTASLCYVFLAFLPGIRSSSYLESEFKREPKITYYDAIQNVKKTLDKSPFYQNKIMDTLISEPGEHFGYVMGGMRHALGWDELE